MRSRSVACLVSRITIKLSRVAGTVTNAVNVAFTITVIGKLILKNYQTKLSCADIRTVDSKSVFRVIEYAEIFLNRTAI